MMMRGLVALECFVNKVHLVAQGTGRVVCSHGDGEVFLAYYAGVSENA
jgi:hypothetical protein